MEKGFVDKEILMAITAAEITREQRDLYRRLKLAVNSHFLTEQELISVCQEIEAVIPEYDSKPFLSALDTIDDLCAIAALGEFIPGVSPYVMAGVTALSAIPALMRLLNVNQSIMQLHDDTKDRLDKFKKGVYQFFAEELKAVQTSTLGKQTAFCNALEECKIDISSLEDFSIYQNPIDIIRREVSEAIRMEVGNNSNFVDHLQPKQELKNLMSLIERIKKGEISLVENSEEINNIVKILKENDIKVTDEFLLLLQNSDDVKEKIQMLIQHSQVIDEHASVVYDQQIYEGLLKAGAFVCELGHLTRNKHLATFGWIGQASVNAYVVFKSATTAASFAAVINPVFSLLNITASLVGTFIGRTDPTHSLILKCYDRLRLQINQLEDRINFRFNNIDEFLNKLYEDTQENFQNINTRLVRMEVKMDQISDSINNLAKFVSDTVVDNTVLRDIRKNINNINSTDKAYMRQQNFENWMNELNNFATGDTKSDSVLGINLAKLYPEGSDQQRNADITALEKISFNSEMYFSLLIFLAKRSLSLWSYPQMKVNPYIWLESVKCLIELKLYAFTRQDLVDHLVPEVYPEIEKVGRDYLVAYQKLLRERVIIDALIDKLILIINLIRQKENEKLHRSNDEFKRKYNVNFYDDYKALIADSDKKFPPRVFVSGEASQVELNAENWSSHFDSYDNTVYKTHWRGVDNNQKKHVKCPSIKQVADAVENSLNGKVFSGIFHVAALMQLGNFALTLHFLDTCTTCACDTKDIKESSNKTDLKFQRNEGLHVKFVVNEALLLNELLKKERNSQGDILHYIFSRKKNDSTTTSNNIHLLETAPLNSSVTMPLLRRYLGNLSSQQLFDNYIKPNTSSDKEKLRVIINQSAVSPYSPPISLALEVIFERIKHIFEGERNKYFDSIDARDGDFHNLMLEFKYIYLLLKRILEVINFDLDNYFSNDSSLEDIKLDCSEKVKNKFVQSCASQDDLPRFSLPAISQFALLKKKIQRHADENPMPPLINREIERTLDKFKLFYNNNVSSVVSSNVSGMKFDSDSDSDSGDHIPKRPSNAIPVSQLNQTNSQRYSFWENGGFVFAAAAAVMVGIVLSQK